MENKLTKISLRAENCEKCRNLVEEEISQTYTSIKEEREKVNYVPSMNVHRLIKRFSLDEISDKYNSNNNNNQINIVNISNYYNNNYIPNVNRNSKPFYNSNNSIKLKYSSNKSDNHNDNNLNNIDGNDIDQNKFINNMNTFNNMNNNSINMNLINEDKILFNNPKPSIENKMEIEDENIFDENAGGLEYFKYLERTVYFKLFNFFYFLLIIFNFLLA